MAPPIRVTWRRHSGQHRQAGRLRTITRNPDGIDRYTVEVVAERTGNIRTLDSVAYEIHIGDGHGIPVTVYANRTSSLFDGAA